MRSHLPSDLDLVPILDRPEERSQFRVSGGRYCLNLVPILDRPEERSQSRIMYELDLWELDVPILDRPEERSQY